MFCICSPSRSRSDALAAGASRRGAGRERSRFAVWRSAFPNQLPRILGRTSAAGPWLIRRPHEAREPTHRHGPRSSTTPCAVAGGPATHDTGRPLHDSSRGRSPPAAVNDAGRGPYHAPARATPRVATTHRARRVPASPGGADEFSRARRAFGRRRQQSAPDGPSPDRLASGRGAESILLDEACVQVHILGQAATLDISTRNGDGQLHTSGSRRALSPDDGTRQGIRDRRPHAPVDAGARLPRSPTRPTPR